MENARGPFTLTRRIVEAAEFVERWEVLYDYKLEDHYARNIGQPLTPERVNALFEWKNGGRLARNKAASVKRNYIDRLPELHKLDQAIKAEEFLTRFNKGGAIWRIYWLHLWAHTRYPIYDQHVHRAMAWIETGGPEEIPASDPAKIRSYLSRFLQFYRQFSGLDPRRVDRALWACGKRMKALTGAPVE